MGLPLLKSTVSFAKSRDRVPPWSTGWRAVGRNPLFLNALKLRRPCPFRRVETEGWVDYFLGQSAESAPGVHSILEGQSRIGLHFCSDDVDVLFDQPCPSNEIPAHLWLLLQQEIQFCRS